jgi:hypothetical protein
MSRTAEQNCGVTSEQRPGTNARDGSNSSKSSALLKPSSSLSPEKRTSSCRKLNDAAAISLRNAWHVKGL